MNKNFSSGLSNDTPGYNEALSWLYSQLPLFSRVGGAAYKPGLDNTIALSRLFSHPERGFRSIHIAGTNGKGSTSHMIASVLQNAGYKTALYTSPHLVDFRERIRINGEMIPRDKVVAFIDQWKNCGASLRPSFFELTMMMAFHWFAEEKVDYAVIETGMGGRLDSTNIISPELCVITNISKDHTQFLGDTLTAIASEKAGIIKPSVPVVIGEAEGEVREVFRKKAEECAAPIIFAQEKPLLASAVTDGHGLMACHSASPEFDFISPLGGDYQRHNINTALHAVAALRKIGIDISPEAEKRGLERVVEDTGLAGRWMVMSEKPTVIADTGHNEAGLSSNFRRLSSMMKETAGATLRFVFGMVADKDVDHVLALLPRDARYYFTQAAIPRALPVGDLTAKASHHNLCGDSYHTVAEAAEAAIADANPDDIIYIGGSTFIVADYIASRNDI